MFGKFGKKPEAEKNLPEIKLNKIPDDFYGGSNPVIKFKEIESKSKKTKAETPVLTLSEKKLLDKKTMAGAGQKLHPINLLANWKFLLLSFLILLLLVAIGFGAYYFWSIKKAQVQITPVEPQVTAPVGPTASETQTLVSSVEETTTTQVVASAITPVLDLPSTLLGDSLDTDKDDVTDVGEELFKTDPAVPDTDNDKYPDGHEIFNLYNPIGKEPMKIVDSGLVSIYSNPAFGYKLYYPSSWAVGVVDPSSRDVLFSTITGENIEVKMVDKPFAQSFGDWLSVNAPKEIFDEYVPVQSVFKQSGYGRKDSLVYFFPTDNYVVAIIYHSGEANVVNYHIINKLIMRSFQFGSVTEIPAPIQEENLSNPVSAATSSATLSSTTTPL